MARGSSRTVAADIRRVAAKLRSYRSGASRQRQLPEGLWASAAELARKYGVSRVAGHLRLDYYKLSRGMPKVR